MKPERISELVASWMNGNISWVNEQIRTKKDLIAVIQEMKKTHPKELDRFLRIMNAD